MSSTRSTFKLAVAAAILSLFGAAPAFAWDCSNPANWTLNVPGNECYRPPTSTQSQTQGQGQSQTAKGGKGGSATSSAVGGAGGVGGSGGAGGVGGAGGASNATGGNQSQTQSSASTSNNAGNAQAITTNDNYTQVHQAVDGYSSGTNTTAGCALEWHAGIGTFVGGASYGRSKRDSDCARQSLARDLQEQGKPEAAARVYCTIKEIKAALGADCYALVFKPIPVAAVVPAPDYVTHADLIEVERRITTHIGSK